MIVLNSWDIQYWDGMRLRMARGSRNEEFLRFLDLYVGRSLGVMWHLPSVGAMFLEETVCGVEC